MQWFCEGFVGVLLCKPVTSVLCGLGFCFQDDWMTPLSFEDWITVPYLSSKCIITPQNTTRPNSQYSYVITWKHNKQQKCHFKIKTSMHFYVLLSVRGYHIVASLCVVSEISLHSDAIKAWIELKLNFMCIKGISFRSLSTVFENGFIIFHNHNYTFTYLYWNYVR